MSRVRIVPCSAGDSSKQVNTCRSRFTMEQERERGIERLGKQQVTTPYRPIKIPALLERRSGDKERKYDSVSHSANGGATWPFSTRPFSTHEATWESQARVQRLPLSEPLDLKYSFLLHPCELRTACKLFTIIASTVGVRYKANASFVARCTGRARSC